MNREEMLISVIIPVYNMENYLHRCLESVVRQTYHNLEIIIVDDGSMDGGPNICDEYASRDSRVKVIHKDNSGVVNSRRIGLEASTGDYVINIDGDDYMSYDRIFHIVHQGLKNSPDLVYMSGFHRDTGHEVYKEKMVEIEGTYSGDQKTEWVSKFAGKEFFLTREIEVALWAWCIKRSIFDRAIHEIDERIRLGEDSITVMKSISYSESVCCIKESGYYYVKRKDSAVRGPQPKDEDERVNILYHQMKTIDEYCEGSVAWRKWILEQIMFCILMTNYKRLIKPISRYLFPFPMIKKGSNVVVYGAGTVGIGLVRALDGNGFCKLVLWVDRNLAGEVIERHTIKCPEEVLKVNYDYIAIAIVRAETSELVENELAKIGVPAGKIARMRGETIHEENLPEDI